MYILLQIIFGSHRFEARYPGDCRLCRIRIHCLIERVQQKSHFDPG